MMANMSWLLNIHLDKHCVSNFYLTPQWHDVDTVSPWWTGKPGGLQSTGSQSVGHKSATERNGRVTIFRLREVKWLAHGRTAGIRMQSHPVPEPECPATSQDCKGHGLGQRRTDQGQPGACWGKGPWSEKKYKKPSTEVLFLQQNDWGG